MSVKIERIPVDSSMVSAVGYDAAEKTLYVEFVNTGYVYAYYEVPKEEWQDLLKADSIGSYMKNNIFDFYNYSKVRRGKDFK
jgi:hypothetical protein